MTNVISMKGVKELPRNAPKTDRATMDTIVVTLAAIDAWKKPPFQRELRVTPRVRECVEQIRRDAVIEGVITLGKFEGETYLLDGQHRIEAFRLAEIPEADVRVKFFTSMGEMAEEFITLNRPLVAMRQDDLMRGLETVDPNIAQIRKRCPFIGYDHVRTDTGKTLVSMATAA